MEKFKHKMKKHKVTFQVIQQHVLIGQLHLFNAEIIFIMNNASSFLWIQANAMRTCGIVIKSNNYLKTKLAYANQKKFGLSSMVLPKRELYKLIVPIS